MTPKEKWRKTQDLFEELEELGPEEREKRLGEVEPECADEVRLLFDTVRAEAAEQEKWRLEAGEPAGGYPEVPGLKLLGPLGAGGSGVIYRALRTVEGAQQMVAVKVLHEHRVDAEDVRRFAREREVMATLNHPAVVHFLDAGVMGDGRPYLVMELVEGVGMEEYCREKRLGVRERVELMVAVCEAVAAAHARFVIHLDLKPSNLLVTPDGQVKLLDLGTARLVGRAEALTVTRQMTPQYASPEQLRAEPATVLSDVYSLGLMLYEVLSGGWPYVPRDSLVGIADRAAGTAETRPLEAVCTEEAAAERGMSLGKLRAALAGDLTLICEKALALDPAERYGAVVELAAELKRYLAGEPVMAHPPAFVYRAKKYVARNRWRLMVGVMVVAGLMGAAVYATWQARRAQAALNQADATMVALEAALGGTDAAANPKISLREFLEKAAERGAYYVPEGEPGVRADFDGAVAQGMLSQMDFARSKEAAERALEYARQAGDAKRVAAAHLSLADVAYITGQMEWGFAEAAEALRLWKEKRSEFTPVRTWNLLSKAGRRMQLTRPADGAAGEAYRLCLEETAGGGAAARYRAECLHGMGMLNLMVGFEYEKAIPLLKEAAAYWRAQKQQQELATVLQALGWAYRYTGRYAEDEKLQKEAAEIMTGLGGRESLAAANYRAVWASSLALTGQAQQGMEVAREAMEVYRKVYPRRADAMLWTPLSAVFMNAYARGEYGLCVEAAREGMETLGPQRTAVDGRRALAKAYLGMGLEKTGQREEARGLIAEALRGHEPLRRKAYLEAEMLAVVGH